MDKEKKKNYSILIYKWIYKREGALFILLTFFFIRRSTVKASLTGSYFNRGSINLDSFQKWMSQQGASDSTLAVYSSRVRSVLRATGVCSADREALAGITRENLEGYLGTLTPGTRTLTLAAWRAYLAFHKPEEGSAYLPEDGRRGKGFRRPEISSPVRVPSGLPPRIQQAAWALLSKGNRPLPPDVLLGSIWKRVRFIGGAGPQEASRAELADDSRSVWVYDAPLTAWCILWEWAAGPARRSPLWNQPLLASGEGYQNAPEAALLLAVVAQGRRGGIPILGDASAATWRLWEPIALPFEMPPVPPPPVLEGIASSTTGESSPPVAEDPLEEWDAAE